MLALVVALAGCSAGSEGLPSGLPGITGGAGSLSITTTTMPDGIINRNYNRIVNIQGGTPPYTCTNTTAMPAGLTLTTAANTCVVSGTPTATGLASFTIQVTDSSLPAVHKSAAFSNYTVRPEYALTSVPVMPDGVQGRSYGTAPQTPPTAITTVSPTVGGGALASCTVTGAGGNTFTGTVVGGANCAASSANLTFAGSFPAVTFSVTDTPITDPANSAIIIVPSKTFMMTIAAPLTVQPPLSVTVNLAPIPDAVHGRTYGSPAKTDLIFTASGGIGNAPTITVSSGAAPTGINCGAAANVLTCNSGNVPVSVAAATSTFTVSASDVANSSTPAGTNATDPLRSTSPTINVDSPLVVTAPASPLGNGTELRAFTATPSFTFSGGLPAAQTVVTCAAGSGVPSGLAVGTAAPNCTLTGNPAGGSSVGSPYNVVVTATDTGNTATPPPSLLPSANAPLTINAPLVLNGGAALVLPQSTVNQPYTPFDIPFTGGNGLAASFTCTDVGAQLPLNMTVATVGSNCEISGTPTSTVNRTITIRVADTVSTSTAAGNTSQAGNLTINNGVSFVTTSPLPAGTKGRAFNFTLTATGGTTPYKFSPTGALTGTGVGDCAGLTMNIGGIISGTPTAFTNTPCVIALTVTDKSSATDTVSFTIPINNTLTVPAFVLGNGVQGRLFDQLVPFSGGNAPYNCSAPALPGTLLITVNGLNCEIKGTPAATFGPTNIIVTVGDTATGSTAAGNANNNSNLTINAALTITTAAVPDAVASRAYNFMLVATGGTGMAPAFTWANPGGSGASLNTGTAACAGLNLNTASGTITGPASATSGACGFLVNVSDQTTASTAGITTANSNFNFTVQPALVVTTTQAQILNGLLNNPYTGLTFTATGGIGAQAWVAPGVNTPPCPVPTGSIDGLALSAAGALSGTPTAASAAPNGFPFQVCVFDVGNAATPAGSATASFTFDVMKNLAYAAGSGALNSVEVINTSTNVLVTTIALGAGASPNGVAITPDGRFAIVAQNGTNKISVIDTILNTQIAGSPVAIPGTTNCGQPAGVGVSPDGVNVYVACDDTTGTNVEEVIVLSAAALTSAPATAFPPAATIVTGAGSKPDAIAFRDATRGYVTLSGSNKLVIINNTGVPVQVGAAFSLTAGRPTPLELTVVPNGAKFYAYIAKENVAGIGAVDVVDVTTDALSIVTSVDVGFNAKPFGVDGVPGTNARVYVALNGSNQYTIFDNSVVTPVIAAAVPALPYFVPDPTAGSGSGVPVGVVIPPLGTVPAGGLPVFITLSATDGVAVVNDAAALTTANAKNAASPIAVTATAAPGLIRSISIPK